MKRRELFWMLLPCLGLALFAIVLRNRPGATLIIGGAPFQMVVESVRREPVTAYEVSQGYDSSLKIVIGHKSDEPLWWGQQSGGFGSSGGARVLFEHEGKLRPIKLPPNFKAEPQVFYWRPTWNNEKKHYVARILTHLSDVPARPGRVVVQANLAIQSNMSTPISAPLWFSHVVRNAGENIKAPVVSRETGLIIEKVEIGPVPPVEAKSGVSISPGADTRIRIVLLRARKENSGSAMGSADIIDEKGHNWNMNSGSSGGSEEASADSDPLRKRREFLTYECDLKQIPLSSGRVWLKTKYSSNNAWPLQIKIPLRDAQGRTLYTTSALQPAPFVVESTKLRAADAQEKKVIGANTVLQVKLKYSGLSAQDAGDLPWRADWSQHLIDEKGKKYWSFKGPNTLIASVTSGPARRPGAPPSREATILYYLPLQQMPARLGRLKFHADIGLPGTERVPVDVVVRESKPTPAPSPTSTPKP